jgi:iron complex outermembrane receptor protein
MKLRYIRYTASAVVIACAAGNSNASFGNEAGDADSSDLRLEEVVVTATKRSESQQNVPISVATTTAKALDEMGVQSTKELEFAVPALIITREATSSTTFLRGVGTGSAAAGQEPSVAYYVDGVYNPSPTSSTMSFNNIDRIEVLRGPQGTLFGRNATGGIIQIITKDPTHESHLDMDAGYGNYETVKSRVYGTTGVTEQLAADLALLYEDQAQGYGKNLALGTDRAGERDLSVRTKWLWTPAEGTVMRVSAFYSDVRSSLGIDRHLAPGAYGVSLTGTPVTAVGGWQDVTTGIRNNGTAKTYGASINFKQQFAGAEFTSITAYRHDNNRFFFDQDSEPAQIVDANVFFGAKTLSQEFQLASDNNGRFTWIGGVFLYSYDAFYDPVNLLGLGLGGITIDVFGEQKSKSAAGFGQVTYKVTEQTGLTAGARLSYDSQELSGQTDFSQGGVPLAPAVRYESFTSAQIPGFKPKVTKTEPTFRLGVDHHFTDNIMGYVSFNHSYKTGVFNLVVNTGVPSPAVNPEKINAYEIGSKLELLEHRVRLNTSAFYYDFKDLQLVTQVAGGQTTRNAASAKIFGGEIELNVVATERLSFGGGVALLHTRYEDFLNGPVETPNPPTVGGNTASTGNFSGNQLVRAPKFTFNGSVRYAVPTSVGDVAATAAYYYNNGFFWDAQNRLAQPSFGIVNATLGWTSRNERYKITLWGDNLTDEKYTIFGNAEALGDQLAPAAPRTYGITFGVKL